MAKISELWHFFLTRIIDKNKFLDEIKLLCPFWAVFILRHYTIWLKIWLNIEEACPVGRCGPKKELDKVYPPRKLCQTGNYCASDVKKEPCPEEKYV